MAPQVSFASAAAGATSWLVKRLTKRLTKGHGEMDWDANLTADQFYILKWVTLVVSAFSMCWSMVAFYWFVRIRRSFKHQ